MMAETSGSINYADYFVGGLKPATERLIDNHFEAATRLDLLIRLNAGELDKASPHLSNYSEGVFNPNDVVRKEEITREKIVEKMNDATALVVDLAGESYKKAVGEALQASNTNFLDVIAYLVSDNNTILASTLVDRMRAIGKEAIMEADGQKGQDRKVSDQEIIARLPVLQTAESGNNLLEAALSQEIKAKMESKPASEPKSEPEAAGQDPEASEPESAAVEPETPAEEKDEPEPEPELPVDDELEKWGKLTDGAKKKLTLLAGSLVADGVGGANVEVILAALPTIKEFFDLRGGGDAAVTSEILKLNNLPADWIKQNQPVVVALTRVLTIKKAPKETSDLSKTISTNQEFYRDLPAVINWQMEGAAKRLEERKQAGKMREAVIDSLKDVTGLTLKFDPKGKMIADFSLDGVKAAKANLAGLTMPVISNAFKQDQSGWEYLARSVKHSKKQQLAMSHEGKSLAVMTVGEGGKLEISPTEGTGVKEGLDAGLRLLQVVNMSLGGSQNLVELASAVSAPAPESAAAVVEPEPVSASETPETPEAPIEPAVASEPEKSEEPEQPEQPAEAQGSDDTRELPKWLEDLRPPGEVKPAEEQDSLSWLDELNEPELAVEVNEESGGPEPELTDLASELPAAEKSSFVELFKRDVVAASYNVFQLVDTQVGRDSSSNLVTQQTTMGNGAGLRQGELELGLGWIQNHLKRVLPEEKIKGPDKRYRELFDLRERLNAEGQVGSSLIVIEKTPQDITRLIIFGAISTESYSSWKGGRTNRDNSLVFEFSNNETADNFLNSFDTKAKGYEGTASNYALIHEAVSAVFPKEVIERMDSHMFRWQEIQEVIDLRKTGSGELSDLDIEVPAAAEEPKVPVVLIQKGEDLNAVVARGLRNAPRVKYQVDGGEFGNYIQSAIIDSIYEINPNPDSEVGVNSGPIAPERADYTAHADILKSSFGGIFKSKIPLGIKLRLDFSGGHINVIPIIESSRRGAEEIENKLRKDLVELESKIVAQIEKSLGEGIKLGSASFDAQGGRIEMDLSGEELSTSR